MPSSAPIIDNARARRLFLDRHGLSISPTGPKKLSKLINELGFVQLDSINTVARAHHMILRARNQSYRPNDLEKLYANRGLFEHWTHDASVIPMEYFPYWRLKCARDEARLRGHWKTGRREGFEAKFSEVLERISTQGACSSSDVGEGEARSSGGWWDWHPSKTALEYLWRSGALSVTGRQGFRKFYDLTEKVIPTQFLDQHFTDEQIIDWACGEAINRLGFATSGELAAFWDLVSASEAREWCIRQKKNGTLVEIDIENADGTPRRCLARPETVLADAPEPPNRVRILSPFDPALRDRKRAERLFGFHYRIEVFVPAPKRRYGYYVFPVLEGTRLIGRVDMKCHRDCEELRVKAFWRENAVPLGAGRMERLRSEIDRMARFTETPKVIYDPDWIKEPLA